MAIEDVVSLAVMLGRGATVDELPRRLKVYEKARHEHATTVQQMARESSQLIPPEKGMSSFVILRLICWPYSAAFGMATSIYSHDEFGHFTQVVRNNAWATGDQTGRDRALKSLQSTFITARYCGSVSSNRYSFTPPHCHRTSFSQITPA